MRYAIISDIHGNLQALKAVLTDIQAIGVDEIICLGDIVGYGPSPAETLELAYTHVHHFILGNHDAVVGGIISPENFNDDARRLIEWTIEQLDPKAAEFFQALPLLISGDNFRCTHGEFERPGRFGYVTTPNEAEASFLACPEPLLLVGHTHIPGFHVGATNAAVSWFAPYDFTMMPGNRYIVNAGSVGQPRDDDLRAAYCVYDLESATLSFRKIPFDIDAYRDDMRQHALPEETSYFLALADNKAPGTVRDSVDFTPLDSKSTATVATAEVDLKSEVSKLKKSTKRLLATSIILALVLAISLVVVFAGTLTPPQPATKPANLLVKARLDGSPVRPSDLPGSANLIPMPELKGAVTPQTPLDKWNVELSDPRYQSVTVEESFDSKKKHRFMTFRIISKRKKHFRLATIPIQATRRERFTASAQFKNVSMWDGFVEIALEAEFPDGTKKILLKREPKNLSRAKKWTQTSITIPPKNPIQSKCELRFVITGTFCGEFLVRKCEVRRKK